MKFPFRKVSMTAEKFDLKKAGKYRTVVSFLSILISQQ